MKIWDLSSIPLPFTDMIGSETSNQEYKEWLTDKLSPPNTANAVVDGSDSVGNDTKVGQRVGNHHQISVKNVRVSYRADASDTLGRAKELAFQLSRRLQELKRDVESIALLNQSSVSDDGNTIAGKAGGLPSWLKTTSKNGTAGGFSLTTGLTVARTAGAAHALSETDVRDVVQGIYMEGGDPTIMMSIPGVIRKFSEYMFTSSARVATLFADQGRSESKASALGSVNVFVSDFGTLKLVPNRLQQMHKDSATKDTADVFIFDPSYLALSYLKGYRTDELAKTGLAENRMMSVDWTLQVNAEVACGIIGDVDPTLATIA